MKATSRHTQRAAQRTHRVVFLLRLDPGVPRAGVLAKYASAFFRISSSCSDRANAWRSRINSACSSERRDRTRVQQGTSVRVRLDLGGHRIIKKKHTSLLYLT